MIIIIIVLGIIVRIIFSIAFSIAKSNNDFNKRLAMSRDRDSWLPTKKQLIKMYIIPFYWWFVLGKRFLNQFD